ncbi:MAG: HlyD family type I secretion periplasmic adaptor subunit [Burkholderiales bacterium]
MNTASNVVPLATLHPAADARRSVLTGLGVIALTFGVVGAWVALAPLAGAIIAPGMVQVETNRKTVQHLEGGIVKEILVRDGDRVTAGQPLIVIGDERVSAQLSGASAQLDAERAKAARLLAERDGLGAIDFPLTLRERVAEARIGDLLRIETTLFETKRRALQEQLALLKVQSNEIRQEVDALTAEVRADHSAAALLEEEVSANERLRALNFVSNMQVLKLKRGVEEYRAKHGESLASKARANQKINELAMRASSLRHEYRQTAADEYTTTQNKIVSLEEQLKPSRDAVTRQAVVAPMAGTVVGIKVFTVGGTVAPREPLLDIVPDDNPLIVEARINLDDIRYVHPGMSADLRFTAYHSRDTPLINGELVYLSADRLTDPNSGASYYLANVRVDDHSLAAAPAMRLQPGMRAEVYLKTARRTTLDYLLEPITGSLRRAMREP